VRLYVRTSVLQDDAMDAGIETRHRPVWPPWRQPSPN